MKYTSFSELPIVLSAEDVADILNINRNAVYEMLRCGKLYSIKIGPIYKIPKDAVEDFLRSA